MANDYVSALTEAMTLIGQDGRTLFIGQTAVYGGSRYTKPTLTGVPRQKLLEPPVTENLQMGISLGLALSGNYIPISIYPRFDFIPLALDQLVNHLDKAELMSKGQFKPKVIIRTIVGGTQPIDPGPQHSQDHSEGVRRLLTNVDFVNLRRAEDIVPAYLAALNSVRSTFLVEYGNLHHKYSANQ